MSITRLQQARQMYASGQRVAKTLDGSRPGYGGPQDYGDEARGTGGYSGSGDTGDFGSEKANVANTKSAVSSLGMDNIDRARANQYKNMPTPTVTVGVDKFDNPINIKTTYTNRRNRQKNLDALNAKGISSFDPRVNKIGINPFGFNFAPTQKKQGFGLFDLALLASGLGLFGAKAKTVGSLVSKGRFALDKSKQITSLANQLGIKNPISNMFSGNNKSKSKSTSTSTSTSKNNTTNNGGNGGDGQGLASLENQAGGYDEYILLLQKLQSGNISDSERNRYNVLKNMLGI